MSLAFDRYFASTLKAGSTAALGYTTKLAFLPVLIVATALGTVIFPVIASQFASNDRAGIRRSTTLALRMVSFIVIPCAAGFIALAYPIVQALFERGAFGPASTALCASLVPFACLPLVAYSYNTVLGRANYACQAVRPAVWRRSRRWRSTSGSRRRCCRFWARAGCCFPTGCRAACSSCCRS